jgi:hypothetical protein
MQNASGDDGARPGGGEIIEADPVDVADQHQAVDPELELDEPDLDDPTSVPLEAEPADVADQRFEVPVFDEDDG